ncbi:thymidylate synthase, partial [Listeria monocytogenes]
PKLVLSDKPATIFDFDVADISLDGYNPDPAIKAPISV